MATHLEVRISIYIGKRNNGYQRGQGEIWDPAWAGPASTGIDAPNGIQLTDNNRYEGAWASTEFHKGIRKDDPSTKFHRGKHEEPGNAFENSDFIFFAEIDIWN